MVNEINGYDFWNMDAMKYWAPTKNKNITTEINNAIFSGDYIAARKVDGHWYMMIKDLEGNIGFRGRSKTVNGDYADKIEWVPHLKEAFAHLPNGTVTLGELHFAGDEGSKKVTTIMGCLKEKAIARQKAGKYLSYYVFDVLCFNGHSKLETPLFERIEYINLIIKNTASQYIIPAQYYEGQKLMDYIGWVREHGYEGIVLQRKMNAYEVGKRTAHHTIKVKKELDHEVDCFLTGEYKPATLTYTGKEIENWTYWFNRKTNEKVNQNRYNDSLEDGTWEPITKGAYYGWAGSIALGVFDGDKEVTIAWISNITEEVKKGIVEHPNEWRGRVVKINAMERDDESGCFRHAKIIEWRHDKSVSDCLLSDI